MNDYLERYGQARYKHTKGCLSLRPYDKRSFRGEAIKAYERTELPDWVDALLKQTLTLRRIDYFSRYAEHNNSPSARNLHSASLLLVWEGALYFYDLYEDLLLSVDALMPSFFSKDSFYILGVCDFYNLARYYGDFGTYLTLLDAGHLMFNVKNALKLNDVAYKYFWHVPETVQEKVSACFSEKSFVAYCIVVDDAPPAPTGGHTVQRKGAVKGVSQSSSEMIATLLKQLRAGPVVTVEESQWPPMVQSQTLIRNSGHNQVGNCRVHYGQKSFSIEAWEVSFERLSKALTPHPIEHKWFVNEETYGMAPLENAVIKPSLKGLLNNDHAFFDMDNFDLALVLYIKREAFEAAGLKETLISAGAQMQSACLLAAQDGLAFRPMKNHCDASIKEHLGLGSDYEILYLGVLCEENIHQISAQIGG